MTKASYTAKDITVLEGLEPVRKRPSMYIGSTGVRGLHHLVYEVVDNSVDEALAGRADRIDLTLHPDNSVTVVDNGSGIPVDKMADTGESALTVVLTKLHAGGKFGGEGYKVSGGLHGVGVSVVNALSERLTAEVRRDGKLWQQEFCRGEPTSELKVIGKAEKGETGTTISFLPDEEIFDEVEWDWDTLVQRLRETAFLTRGPAHRHERRARRRREGRVPVRGRHPRLRRVRERAEGPRPQAHRLLRGRVRRAGQGRGRDAVEHEVRRVGLLVREQHPHARGRLAPLRLPGRSHAHAEQVRAVDGAPQGEGGEPRGRRRARRAGSGDLREAARPAVRGPDEDEARQRGRPRPRRADGQRQALRVPRGEPGRSEADHLEGDLGGACPAGGPQGS